MRSSEFLARNQHQRAEKEKRREAKRERKRKIFAGAWISASPEISIASKTRWPVRGGANPPPSAQHHIMALIEGKSDTSHSLVVLTAGFPTKVGHNVKNKQTYEKQREKTLTESGGRIGTWSMRNQASWRDETNTQLHDSDAMPRTEETHSLSLYFDGAVEPSVGVSRMYMGLHGRWR